MVPKVEILFSEPITTLYFPIVVARDILNIFANGGICSFTYLSDVVEERQSDQQHGNHARHVHERALLSYRNTTAHGEYKANLQGTVCIFKRIRRTCDTV